MIKTKCLGCGCALEINLAREGEGYFFGYDTDYYGDSFDDMRDPHHIIGHYCKKCGEKLEVEAKGITNENL